MKFAPRRRIKYYGASKILHSGLWLSLDDSWSDIAERVSRWPTLIGQIPDDEVYAKVFWNQNHEDILACEVLIVYAGIEDNLRGALVEAGIALALERKVITIGNNPNFGTWQYHTGVHRVKDLDECKTLLYCMSF